MHYVSPTGHIVPRNFVRRPDHYVTLLGVMSHDPVNHDQVKKAVETKYELVRVDFRSDREFDILIRASTPISPLTMFSHLKNQRDAFSRINVYGVMQRDAICIVR